MHAPCQRINIISTGSVHTVEKTTKALLVTSVEIDLEMNADKTKYTVMSHDQNAVRSYNIKTDNSLLEKVEQFKYLGTTLTNQNSIQEEIKSRLKSENARCHLLPNRMPSSQLYTTINIWVYTTVI
jgi:hypothetical protein